MAWHDPELDHCSTRGVSQWNGVAERMFLLSDTLIRRYIVRRDLSIRPLEENNLSQTCYYFRIGQYADILTDDQGPVDVKRNGLTLPPTVMARVQSLENFSLPENVLGLLGTQTNLPIERRIQMIHGPSIDPGYSGPIEFVVINIGQRPVELQYGTRIGKLMLFDVTETSIDDVRLFDSARRRQDRLRRYGTEDENPDADFMNAS
jgi:deoxycytidine triphosphate deaminase